MQKMELLLDSKVNILLDRLSDLSGTAIPISMQKLELLLDHRMNGLLDRLSDFTDVAHSSMSASRIHTDRCSVDILNTRTPLACNDVATQTMCHSSDSLEPSTTLESNQAGTQSTAEDTVGPDTCTYPFCECSLCATFEIVSGDAANHPGIDRFAQTDHDHDTSIPAISNFVSLARLINTDAFLDHSNCSYQVFVVGSPCVCTDCHTRKIQDYHFQTVPGNSICDVCATAREQLRKLNQTALYNSPKHSKKSKRRLTKYEQAASSSSFHNRCGNIQGEHMYHSKGHRAVPDFDTFTEYDSDLEAPYSYMSHW
jgi:hypothetical protein